MAEIHANVTRRRCTRLALAAVLGGLPVARGAAQDYPARAIRLVVPFPAGGSTDLVARAVADPLRALLGQPVVVENRPGAGGALGSEQVARAAADGYTLLMGGGQNVLLAALGQGRGWDPVGDFVPVAVVADIPNVLAAAARSPFRDMAEAVARAKARPGTLTYGSAGLGSASHLVGELFTRRTGADIVHVPYRGNQPALTDLVGGQIDLMFSNLAGTLSHMGDGSIRLLAITGARRSSLAPDVPTFGEQGVGGLEAGVWMGVMAPKGAPEPVVGRLAAALGDALQQRETLARLRTIGAEPAYAPPPNFAARVAAELEQWRTVVRDADIKLQ
jgi:tripartite-type tricarboxylate transporter receptor subunit TctC